MINFKLKGYFNIFFILIVTFYVFEYILLKQTPFFWDAVSKSYRAHWFYNANFDQFTLPTLINSGHPPLWPLMLAGWWKIFGLSLESSRFLLMLINILIGYQILKLIEMNLAQKASVLVVFLMFLEPTFLAQTTILNNDMLLLLFTFLAYNLISNCKKRNNILFTIALTGLLFSNLRGMLLFATLLIIDFLFFKFNLRNKDNKIVIIPYLISAGLFILFLIYHYYMLGWMIKTPSPNWSEQRNVAPFTHIIKNAISIVRNFIDFGRVGVIFLTSFLIYQYLKNYKFKSDLIVSKLIVSIGVFSIGLSLFFMFFTNPIGHRYYMVSYLLIVLLCIILLKKIYDKIVVNKFLALLFVAFISGHFYIYPSTISQGWDSSLGYLNYFENRNKIEWYIISKKLDKNKIGTNLPLNNKQYSDLIPKNENEAIYSELNTKINKYIILSNIENTTTDEDIKYIKNYWILIEEQKTLGVYVSLYKNPNF